MFTFSDELETFNKKTCRPQNNIFLHTNNKPVYVNLKEDKLEKPSLNFAQIGSTSK